MLEKNVRYAHVSRAKKWKNITKCSFYQKMYKNIICSFQFQAFHIPRIFLYLSTLQNGRSCGHYLRACGQTVRPILTKSLFCRLLLISNIHTKFQVSNSYRSQDIQTTNSKNAKMAQKRPYLRPCDRTV
ncbi:hypothetical protein WDU94_007631 [Cyamophila willieti]